jgi:hypothetical protein
MRTDFQANCGPRRNNDGAAIGGDDSIAYLTDIGSR